MSKIYILHQKTAYILPVLLAILPIFSVFFPEKLIPVVIMLTIVVSLLEENKKENFKKNRGLLLPHFIFSLVCLLFTIVSKDFFTSIKGLERYLSLILIPLVVFCSNMNEKRLLLFFRAFVVSMLLVSFFSVGRLIWFVIEFSDWIEVMRKVNENDTYVQFKYPHLMWDAHPSYWSYLIILTNIILLDKNVFGKIFTKIFTIFLLIVFNINLFYLAARIPLIINSIVLLIFIFIHFRNNNRYLLLSILIFFSAFAISYFKLPFFQYKILAIKNDDRFFLWPIAIQKIKENYFIFGEGLGMGKIYIENYLSTIDDTRNNYKGLEIHNEYLTFLLETGFLGAFSLLFLYLKPAFVFDRNIGKFKMYTSIFAISLLFILASATEPVFKVIKGIIIFSVFSSVFSVYCKKNFSQ